MFRNAVVCDESQKLESLPYPYDADKGCGKHEVCSVAPPFQQPGYQYVVVDREKYQKRQYLGRQSADDSDIKQGQVGVASLPDYVEQEEHYGEKP